MADSRNILEDTGSGIDNLVDHPADIVDHPADNLVDHPADIPVGNPVGLQEPMEMEKESSMLKKPPLKFTFDIEDILPSIPSPKNTTTANTIQEQPQTTTVLNNPTYFEEAFNEESTSFGLPEVDQQRSTVMSIPRSIAPAPPRPRFFKLPPPVPLHRFEISRDDVIEEQEIDVFLNPATETEENTSAASKSEKRASPFGRLTQFFWKSKSSSKSTGSSSVVSEGSRSRSTSSGISSPPFTPDSSLSIYTNSVDSDSHCSSHSQPSTGSDQGHYPDIHFQNPGGQRSHDLDMVTPGGQRSHDLDMVTPIPVYSNVKGSFRGPRKYSVPSPPNTFPNRRNPLPFYYNTQNLETFNSPNNRRHSVSGPSSPVLSPEVVTDAASSTSGGYLVPIHTRPTFPAPASAQVQYKNVYFSDPASEETTTVEVHSPTTSSHTYSDMFCDSSASTAIPLSVYSGDRRRPSQASTVTLNRHPSTSSSNAGDIASVLGISDGRRSSDRHAQPQQANSSNVRREFPGTGTDCELYCKFCSSPSLPRVPYSRSSRMNVGILSSQGCFFSKSAVSQITKIFETIVGPDRRKINVNVQAFDIQEIGENVKGVELHRAKIQIVVISHSFLDHLRHSSSVERKVSPVNRILRSRRVIAILLSGVVNSGTSGSGTTSGTSGSSEAGDGIQQYLVEFSKWETLELKPSSKLDSEFYKKFTEKVIGIYTAEQPAPAGFSIFPKKVTKYQSKVVIFFKSPIETEDKVTVQLRRGRRKEYVQEVVLVNPYSGIIQMPMSLFEDDRSVLLEITVTLNDVNLGSKALKYDHNSHLWEDEVEPECREVQSENSDGTSCDTLMSPQATSGVVTPSSLEYYDMPRPTKQDYCIPPAARPIVPKKPKKLRPISPILEDGHVSTTNNNNSSPENTTDTCTNADESVAHYANIVTSLGRDENSN